MATSEWKIGSQKHGFTVTGITPLQEINITLIELQHARTGARMVHLAANDPNNLFAVGFRTPPDDSTGIAHILEHTTLCGSRRFPVRDPFFSMLKRSLNTFMNAMTASDWTLYPFSSQNKKDFYNLLDIYLDATFFPLLNERDFRQEGHRMEFETQDDPETPLLYKGVVYNEMKGAMSDPSSLLSRRLGPALYPTTTYRHNSGGEPVDIPKLTWQQLRDFHDNYYHPTNAYFFTYGDLPLEKHLQVIEEQALKHFSKNDIDSTVPAEARRDKISRVVETFPLDPGLPTEKRSMVQVAWLTCDINDSLDRLALSLLANLLLGNPASPLYKALLDSGLGSNLAPGIGYHDDNRTTYFASGLQGADPEQAEAIEKLTLDTLEQVARKGFSKERIEATLHRLEFSTKEVTGDQYPYPLVLLMRLLSPWIHGGNPVDALRFDDLLTRLRKELEAGPYFENLIRRYLLDNPHRVTLTLKPDPTAKESEEAETRATLAEIKQALSDKQKQALVEQARQLQAAQEEEDDLSCLPTLELSDIVPEEPAIKSSLTEVAGTPIRWFDQPTNGIAYVSGHLDTSGLSEDQLGLLPIFCTLLTQIGASGYSHTDMAERMEAVTGGIFLRTVVLDNPVDITGTQQGIVTLKGKALVRNQGKMLEIIRDIFTAPDFTDLKRLHTVINQVKTSMENSIPSSGHSYAARSAASQLTAAGRLRELWGGLQQVHLTKELAKRSPEQLGEFAATMASVAGQLLCRERISLSVCAEKQAFDDISASLASFIDQLPSGTAAAAPAAPSFAPHGEYRGWATSVPVNYVSRVFRTVPYTHPDSAALLVLSKLMRADFLHREIREKGGAYGGMASCNIEGGTFSLLSYRDPHLSRTLNVYDQSVEWAMKGDFGKDAIKEAVLAVFAELDRPISPGSRGIQEFGNIRQGLTLEMRNELRRQVLAMDGQALMEAAAKYLATEKRLSAVSIIASESTLKAANSELDDCLIIEQI